MLTRNIRVHVRGVTWGEKWDGVFRELLTEEVDASLQVCDAILEVC